MIDRSEMLIDTRSFTRSNGTTLSRLYERLTKASRRRVYSKFNEFGFTVTNESTERAYRQGIRDAYRALQEELIV